MNDTSAQLMITREVAAYFRTSPETVRYWRHINYGPRGRKIGRKVLYERKDVEAFWDALATGSGG